MTGTRAAKLPGGKFAPTDGNLLPDEKEVATAARRIPTSDVTIINASVQHQIDYLGLSSIPEDHPAVDAISEDIGNREAMMIACVACTPHGMAAKVDVLLRLLGYRCLL